jgi:hypothetical protein
MLWRIKSMRREFDVAERRNAYKIVGSQNPNARYLCKDVSSRL